MRDPEVLKARLWVEFDGERGLDYGGLTRSVIIIFTAPFFNNNYIIYDIIIC